MHILRIWTLERAIVMLCMMIIDPLALLGMGTGCRLEDIPTSTPIASATDDDLGCEEASEGAPMVDPRTVGSFTTTMSGVAYFAPLEFDVVGACEYDGELTYSEFQLHRVGEDSEVSPDICAVFHCGPGSGLGLYAFTDSWEILIMEGPGILGGHGPYIAGTPHYRTRDGNGAYDRIAILARTPIKLALMGRIRADAPRGDYQFVIEVLENGVPS